MHDQDFIKIINLSRHIEYEICTWYKNKIDPKTRMALPKTKGFDILCPTVGNVEVKWDRLAVKTDNYAIEFEDQDGQKSGITATTAGEFVIVDDEMVIRSKLTSLLFLIRDCTQKRTVQMGYTTKEGKRAWGYLIPRNYLLMSPYVEPMERWFT